MHLSNHQIDRAIGAVLASAAGDALGAGYEFDGVLPGPGGPGMIGGGLGGFAPGEWTDDTTMAWCVLDVAATGADLRGEAALTGIARRFVAWVRSGPKDIGIQTGGLLRGVPADVDAATLAAAATRAFERTGGEGNGSLMRTGPVALAHLDSAGATAEAARAVSALTHAGPLSQEACVLWSLAVRHAILAGELNVRVGLAELAPGRRALWEETISAAEAQEPATFRANGFVVGAFQAAWSAIVHTPVPTDRPACEHLQDALATAIGIGHDTDTVAAIAGSLLGARWGESAVPAAWRRVLHGYPGVRAERLQVLAYHAVTGQRAPDVWPQSERMNMDVGVPRTLVRHPFDAGVYLANGAMLGELPDEVDAVVSLCRIGTKQVRDGVERVGFRLVDQPGQNQNLEFVLRDAARTVAALRDAGKVVVVHCVAAQSRTPAVGIAYAIHRGHPADEAVPAVLAALPAPAMNPELAALVRRL